MDGAGTEEEERMPERPEYKAEKKDTFLSTEDSVVDTAAVCGRGSSVLSASQSTAVKEVEDTLVTGDGISPVKKVEEDGRYCTLQATRSTSQDSAALDSQPDLASACGQLSNVLSDMEAVPLLSVVEFAQEPTGQSGSHEQCEGYYLDGVTMEAKKKKGINRSGVGAEKACSGMPGDLCRQDVWGPAACRSSKCASANAAALQSCKVSSVLESGSSHFGTKGKKLLLENPEILPPVRKKSRTFYSAEQLEELEKMFQEDHYPDNEKRREIAAVVGVTPQRIMVWFQNRRAKWRKLEKLSAKENKKYPTPSALSDPLESGGYGPFSPFMYTSRAPLQPMPPLPGIAHDQSAMLSVDTTAGKYSNQLSRHPTSSSVPSVAGVVASCEAVQAKALPQLSFSCGRMECFPSLPSPPPIRRASLPLSLSINPHSHVVPFMMGTPSSECSLSTQQNGSREAFSYSIQNQGLSSPVSCNYPEQLESADNLEIMYCQYSSQGGIYQLPQYSQQQFHHLPGHLASNVFPSVCLSPTTPTESQTAFLTLPTNSGVVAYGAAGNAQGYVQNQTAGELLVQQPSGNSAAHQAVPWNDFYMQGAPFSNQLHSQMPLSSTAGGQYFTEQTSYTQPPCLPSSPHFLQVPNGTTLGSVPHAGNQKGVTPPKQSSSQNHQTEPELTSLAEREEVERSSRKGETIVDIEEGTND